MPLVVHYWTDLQSVHRARVACYGNITRTRNVSEYMLVLAACLVMSFVLKLLTPKTVYISFGQIKTVLNDDKADLHGIGNRSVVYSLFMAALRSRCAH